MLLWKAMQNALPVGENLKQRNIKPDAKCPHCGEEESVLHLFFSCSFASQVWNQLPCKSTLSLTSISNFQQGLIATKTLTCLPPTGLGAGPLAPWIFWSIWNARNQKIFNQRQISPKDTVLQGILRAKEWQSAQPIEEATNRSQPQSKPIRSKSDPDITVCHTDAAWDEKTRSGGFGWTFTDSRAGLRREGKAASPHVRSPLLAEASAIRLALLHATELGITKLSVASDSKLLIEAINSEIPSKEIHGIHHDILSLSKSFLTISFSFVPREMNREADSLAKLSLQNYIV